MSRNAESHFAVNPTRIDMSRSRFDRSSSYKTTFNVGQIIPFYVDEVLPGDTFSIDTSKVVRMQTLLTPVMDDIFLDTYYFFVPNRLTWSHWKQFMGENTESAWIPSVEYEVPQLTAPEGGWNIGTIADYLGIPTGVSGLSVNALPFRAYALIMNEWFRDENLSDPLNIPVTDATVQGVNTGTFVTDVAKGGLPYTAAKYHDYFTSALPAPQKGPDVTIPVAEAATAYVYPAATLNPDLASRFHELQWVQSNGQILSQKTPNAVLQLGFTKRAGASATQAAAAIHAAAQKYGYDVNAMTQKEINSFNSDVNWYLQQDKQAHEFDMEKYFPKTEIGAGASALQILSDMYKSDGSASSYATSGRSGVITGSSSRSGKSSKSDEPPWKK